MPLDYASPRSAGRGPGPFTRFLLRPLHRVVIIAFALMWIAAVFYTRRPPNWDDEVVRWCIPIALLDCLLAARILIRFALLHYHQRHEESPKVVRDGLMMLAALLLPVGIYTQLPLAIAFAISRPAMNRVHQWAIGHPGGQLPAQWIGVYWAEDITATADGVSFRVWGAAGKYGSRSGFVSGKAGPPDGVAERGWPTSDRLWKTWGYDY